MDKCHIKHIKHSLLALFSPSLFMDRGDGVDSFSLSSQHHGLAALDKLEVLFGKGGEHDDRGGADVFALGDIFAAQVGVEGGDAHLTISLWITGTEFLIRFPFLTASWARRSR